MTVAAADDSASDPHGMGLDNPTVVAGRYEVLGLLGRGGMASVYRVRDGVTDACVALKRLAVPTAPGPHDGERLARVVELFEREFHTLNQLAHPRIVQAFDYGVEAGCPYYTMELLDGGDLRELAPLPWQEVCLIGYEVSSALSLLHSRGLVHRDLTPRNVRRTGDGKAKLIDFGLLSPMGATSLVAGTPPYVAPELLQVMTLDGRSDVFSLGATLYQALTGRTAYPARTFAQLLDTWRGMPPPLPSRVVLGIPAAVDELIMDLIRIDVGSRPKSVAEVMERLRPLLDEPPTDELSAASAYLAAPRLVGRDDALVRFRKQVLRTVRRKGGGLLLSGPGGCGRSRMLDSFVLEGKMIGACTLRAGADEAASGAFGVAQALVAQLCRNAPTLVRAFAGANAELSAILFRSPGYETAGADGSVGVPEVAPLGRPEVDAARAQAALVALFAAVATRRPVALAVDDFDRVDGPSAAFIAALTWEARNRRLVYAVAVEEGSPGAQSESVWLLRKAAQVLELAPLAAEQTLELLRLVFGDVPHIQMLSARLHGLSGGLPRDCMALAQQLVDQGVIEYTGGRWKLPEVLQDGALPERMADAIERRVAGLGPLGLELGRLLALAEFFRPTRASLVEVVGAVPGQVDWALDQLRAAGLVTGGPGGYALRHAGLAEPLLTAATSGELVVCHGRLAQACELQSGSAVAIAFHELQGPAPGRGLDRFSACTPDGEARTTMVNDALRDAGDAGTARTVTLALEHAARIGRHQRDVQSLWVVRAAMASRGQDARHYYALPEAWLRQLKHDSGYDDWHALDDDLAKGARITQAFGMAQARFDAAPQHERVQAPIDAIKQLVFYVLASIAVGVRTGDLALLAGLPRLVEPFVPLSPAAASVALNARSTLLNTMGAREASREGFVESRELLKSVDAAFANTVRSSIRQTIFEIDASLGIPALETDSEFEYRDPTHLVGTEYIRKVIALHLGDWVKAEDHRQRAELIALQNRSAKMFSTLGQELEVHALARDLTGLRRVRDGIVKMAEEHPGWMPMRYVADAHYQRMTGDADAALATLEAFHRSQEGVEVRSPWRMNAAALQVELLLEQGNLEGAMAVGREALSVCERERMRHLGRLVACALCRVEGARGDFRAAFARIDGVIAEQRRLGVEGLLLGYAYECGARIAIDASDPMAFERYAQLAAGEYRPGESDVFGALHARLTEAAAQAGVVDVLETEPPPLDGATSSTCWSHVSTVMSGCVDRLERAQRALGLLCNDATPRSGFLFLLTDVGLSLAAFNAAYDDRSAVTSHAEGLLDVELDDGFCTVTSLGDPQEPAAPGAGIFEAQDGTVFKPLVLSADLSGQRHIVGLALLSGAGELGGELREVAGAVARNLMDSGDYKGMVAL